MPAAWSIWINQSKFDQGLSLIFGWMTSSNTNALMKSRSPRRAELGLPPLSEYRRLVEQQLHLPSGVRPAQTGDGH
jgi:hypothetical protein